MIAEALEAFRDLDAGVLREAGDRFEVSPERFAAINGTRYGELAREVTPEPRSARNRRTSKK